MPNTSCSLDLPAGLSKPLPRISTRSFTITEDLPHSPLPFRKVRFSESYPQNRPYLRRTDVTILLRHHPR